MLAALLQQRDETDVRVRKIACCIVFSQIYSLLGNVNSAHVLQFSKVQHVESCMNKSNRKKDFEVLCCLSFSEFTALEQYGR